MNRYQSRVLHNLDAKQRRTLTLIQRSREIAVNDIAELFGYKPRTAALSSAIVGEID
jgi:hypothetical protein